MIAIIDYKAGNLRSVERALRGLGFPCRITADSTRILEADRVVFPGVGAAGRAMADLRQLGLDRVLRRALEEGHPFLGICLGAQVILERSEEDHAACLGLMAGEARSFPVPLPSPENGRLKIPHMGWNGVTQVRKHPVLKGIGPEDEFYFVHAYYPAPASQAHVIGTTDYGIRFPSIIGRRNLIAMQFHPEKSGRPGLQILKNFCEWDGNHAE
ncbi:MAG TPA: imidazole glycerol phosphate synthase subunit HisH [Desulfobacteraceae bacterium]|jgi:imidazole glycerol-phosphate synthase subunit HisH|nr:imidazole glycerol phosphate synthase subunit HisH [Desulfobacteraceae bacterium]